MLVRGTPMEPPETFSLKVGETLVRRLAGLASAGYQWGARAAPGGIVSVALSFDEEATRTPGATFSRDTLATIVALAPGEAEVVFEQKRAFEANALRCFSIRVSVAAAGPSA